ncbi:hypothetical protein [Muribaculum sp.]|uniref:hypothetical protein n=1 Tax=Muribaculum sp. TaxID=1918611 RepID=UPI0023CD9CE9|nr:hypothetical protein [Muribaculum sp.]MDE5705518.1 hypothetical protein [Muribaculum sp.]
MDNVLNISIDKLLSLGYELEGLLLSARKRGDATPVAMWNMILEKAAEIHSTAGDLSDMARQDTVGMSSDTADMSSAAGMSELQDENSVNISDNHVADVYEVDCDIVCSNPLTVESVDSADEIASDDVAPDAADGDDVLSESIADNEVVADEAEYSCQEDEAVAEEPLRLDEKLAREGSRNLRKAFSLNDRFRFRRELFGNSDIEMSDTLNLVEAMSSYSEAVDYFMTDLQWDADNQEVKDFMEIIEKHFATR